MNRITLKEWLIVALIFICYGIVSDMDYCDALRAEQATHRSSHRSTN